MEYVQVDQFLLTAETAAGKKHYHWRCNCALHNLTGACNHSRVVSTKKSDRKIKGVATRSSNAQDLPASAFKDYKRQSSIGNLLELLDSRKSQEEIRRDAAKKGSL